MAKNLTSAATATTTGKPAKVKRVAKPKVMSLWIVVVDGEEKYVKAMTKRDALKWGTRDVSVTKASALDCLTIGATRPEIETVEPKPPKAPKIAAVVQ